MVNTGSKRLDDIIEEFDVEVTPEFSQFYMAIADEFNEKDKALLNAGRDGLTQLYRTEKMYEEMKKHLALTQREGHNFSIAIGDIDDFKRYNDTYGHIQANQVLKTTAKIMSDTKRIADSVMRYGGEEFVLLMPETDSEGAFEVVERIRENIAETMMPINPGIKNDDGTFKREFPDEGYRTSTMSFGLVTYHKKFNQILGFSDKTYKSDTLIESDTLIDCADTALYGAKGKKNVPENLVTPKNCTCIYTIHNQKVVLPTRR